MIALIWVGVAVLLGLWTGLVALGALLAEWAVGALASGGGLGAAAEALSQWPVPAWAALWVDVGLLENLKATALAAAQWLEPMLPALGTLLGWVVPLMWVLWGLVAVLMLLLAGGAHVLLSRRSRAPRRPVTA